MTQLESAIKGITTPEMVSVAKAEEIEKYLASLPGNAKKVVKGGSGPGAFGSILYNDQTDGDGNVIAGSGSRNLSALKVSFSQATGILSGSFELNYERKMPSGSYAQKKKTVTLKGVYVPFYSMADDAG